MPEAKRKTRLSDAEIAAEFNSPTPVRTNGLIADWRLSSGSTAANMCIHS